MATAVNGADETASEVDGIETVSKATETAAFIEGDPWGDGDPEDLAKVDALEDACADSIEASVSLLTTNSQSKGYRASVTARQPLVATQQQSREVSKTASPCSKVASKGAITQHAHAGTLMPRTTRSGRLIVHPSSVPYWANKYVQRAADGSYARRDSTGLSSGDDGDEPGPVITCCSAGAGVDFLSGQETGNPRPRHRRARKHATDGAARKK